MLVAAAVMAAGLTLLAPASSLRHPRNQIADGKETGGAGRGARERLCRREHESVSESELVPGRRQAAPENVTGLTSSHLWRNPRPPSDPHRRRPPWPRPIGQHTTHDPLPRSRRSCCARWRKPAPHRDSRTGRRAWPFPWRTGRPQGRRPP